MLDKKAIPRKTHSSISGNNGDMSEPPLEHTV